MMTAFITGIYFFAAVLAIGLFSQSLLCPGGWGQQFWRLDDAAISFLRWVFGIVCLAGLLFLVPRQIVLAASADQSLVGGSQTLERLLMLAFQSVIFVLALRAGWPGSPLMNRVLAPLCRCAVIDPGMLGFLRVESDELRCHLIGDVKVAGWRYGQAPAWGRSGSRGERGRA